MKKYMLVSLLLMTVSLSSFAQDRFSGAAKKASAITDLHLCLEGNRFAPDEASSCAGAMDACFHAGMSKKEVAGAIIDFADSFLNKHKYELLAENKYESTALELAGMKERLFEEFPELKPRTK